jgi:hypothetical protein
MSLGLREGRFATRRRRRRRIIWWLVVVLSLGAVAYQAYEAGSHLARWEVTSLSEKIGKFDNTVAALEARTIELEAALQVERERGQEWRQRYQTDVPTGLLKEYLDLIQKRLGDGLTTERLAFLINTAHERRSCAGEPISKRFLAQTLLHKGANDSVSFASNIVTVTAIGKSVRDKAGNPEAWYDPAQPIDAIFTVIGGKISRTEGKLPMHFSVVVNAEEFLFTLTAGDRGFINVTADRCDYP